ncbi:hypothetical protein GCM10011512_00560 [Tersicoccus solisilvae]|uniref:Uncharacterized protein n=1 Tax=Tersicoccus solisilvae TaxID=1882339 RepID=A0ABQ1NIE1_9MICC|nr:hypothetical protein [Tersicoccus solisilvae]GGC77931.1 hypothetical protein GCM10011512_00560 [Tersicoccus solisilvae]
MSATTRRAPSAGPADGPGPPDRDRILPYSRVVAAVVVPFLAVAVVLLYGLPTRTAELFAWTIEPPLTAMLLGATYLGGIAFFAAVLRRRPWHRVRHGMPAVIVFATALGIATLLHLDRFHPWHVSFMAWAALYATAPVLVLVLLLRNGPEDPGTPEPRDTAIPAAARGALAALGAVAGVAGVALFLAPALGSLWPWDLTPLTARVVGAILTLPALINVPLLWERRWSAYRLLVRAELVGLAATLLALVLRAGDLRLDRPATPVVAAVLVAAFVAFAVLSRVLDRRRERPPASPAT